MHILQPPRKAMFPLPVPSANHFWVIKTEICRSVPSILWCRFCSLWAWCCAWTFFYFSLHIFFSWPHDTQEFMYYLWPSLCLFQWECNINRTLAKSSTCQIKHLRCDVAKHWIEPTRRACELVVKIACQGGKPSLPSEVSGEWSLS